MSLSAGKVALLLIVFIDIISALYLFNVFDIGLGTAVVAQSFSYEWRLQQGRIECSTSDCVVAEELVFSPELSSGEFVFSPRISGILYSLASSVITVETTSPVTSNTVAIGQQQQINQHVDYSLQSVGQTQEVNGISYIKNNFGAVFRINVDMNGFQMTFNNPPQQLVLGQKKPLLLTITNNVLPAEFEFVVRTNNKFIFLGQNTEKFTRIIHLGVTQIDIADYVDTSKFSNNLEISVLPSMKFSNGASVLGDSQIITLPVRPLVIGVQTLQQPAIIPSEKGINIFYIIGALVLVTIVIAFLALRGKK